MWSGAMRRSKALQEHRLLISSIKILCDVPQSEKLMREFPKIGDPNIVP